MVIGKKMQKQEQMPKEWVLDVLDRNQLVAEKQERVGKRQLGPGMVFMMWLLRLYVLLMVFLVAHQILLAIH